MSAGGKNAGNGWREVVMDSDTQWVIYSGSLHTMRLDSLAAVLAEIDSPAAQPESATPPTKPTGKPANKRELLLTFPEQQKRETWEWYDPVSGESEQGFETQQDAYDARPSIGAVVSKVEAKDSPQNYRSSHFDQPNILAHVRFNERTDPSRRVAAISGFVDSANAMMKSSAKGSEAVHSLDIAKRRCRGSRCSASRMGLLERAVCLAINLFCCANWV